MTSLAISDNDIADCSGKTVVISGGGSGIGFAAAKIFAAKNAKKILILDVNPALEPLPSNAEHLKCNIASWHELLNAFEHAGTVDIACANAGVGGESDFLADAFDDNGVLQEPAYTVIDVNMRGTLNFIKVAASNMRRNKTRGSIVITASATAYAPEQCFPVYSAAKLALIGLVRALRSTYPRDGITINAVAPAATITQLLPQDLAAPIIAQGLPVSSAEHVGRAVAFSATSNMSRRVELYGKDAEGLLHLAGRWNGRCILTLGDTYTELEEPIADLRPQWFGAENARLTNLQQTATDFRDIEHLQSRLSTMASRL